MLKENNFQKKDTFRDLFQTSKIGICFYNICLSCNLTFRKILKLYIYIYYNY